MRDPFKYIAFCCLVSLFLPASLLPARAQGNDVSFFQEEAGSASVLFRGHQAHGYHIRYNGTYWWFSPDFLTGDVSYNGKLYRQLPLNIAAARQELVVKSDATPLGKVLAREFVTAFTLDGRRFLNLGQMVGPQDPGGYWEILYDGRTKFLRRISKKLLHDYNGSKRQMVAEGDPYDPNIHETFVRDIAYGCLTEDGQFVPIRSKQQLLKLYAPLRREIRRHVAAVEGRYNTSMNLEDYGIAVLTFVESR